MKDVGDRFVNFSDIVKECDALHAPACPLVQIECVAEDEGIPRHSANVRASHCIVRIDCVQQRLERRRSEPLRKNALTPLADH